MLNLKSIFIVILASVFSLCSFILFAGGFDVDLSHASFESHWSVLEIEEGGIAIEFHGIDASYDVKTGRIDVKFDKCLSKSPVFFELENGFAKIEKKGSDLDIIEAMVFSKYVKGRPIVSMSGSVSASAALLDTSGPVISSKIVFKDGFSLFKGRLFPDILGIDFVYRNSDRSQIINILVQDVRFEQLLHILGRDVIAGGDMDGAVMVYNPQKKGIWHVFGCFTGKDAWVSREFLSGFLLNSKAIFHGQNIEVAMVNRYNISISGQLPSVNVKLELDTDAGKISFSWLADLSSYAILENS